MKLKYQNEKRNYKPVKIGESLRTVNQKILYKFGKLEYIIYARWAEIVGAFFMNHSEPEKITIFSGNYTENDENNQKKILHVNVTPAAAVEFQHFQNKIIEKINSFFGYQAIHNIKIHQKLINKNRISNMKKSINKDRKIDQKKIEIKNTIHKINDKELEKSLLNLGVSISTNEEN